MSFIIFGSPSALIASDLPFGLYSPATDNKKVRLCFPKKCLSIPRNYIWSAFYENNAYGDVRLHIMLPELAPPNKENFSYFQFPNLTIHKVQFSIRNLPEKVPPAKYPEDIVPNFLFGYPEHRVHESSDGKITTYEKELSGKITGEKMMMIDNDGTKTLVLCGAYGGATTTCTGHIYDYDEFIVSYMIIAKNMIYYKAIDNKIRSVVSEFIRDADN